MAALLCIAGTSYCPSATRHIKTVIEKNIPFIYLPFALAGGNVYERKKQYWKSLRPCMDKATKARQFDSFPTFMLMEKKGSDKHYIIYDWEHPRDDVKIIKEIEQDLHRLKPLLLKTFGCSTRNLKDKYHYVSTHEEALERFGKDLGFAYCPE